MYWRGILTDYFFSRDDRISIFSGIIAIVLFYLSSIYFRTYLELPAEIPYRMPYLAPALTAGVIMLLFLIPILKGWARAKTGFPWFLAKGATTLNVLFSILLTRLFFAAVFSPYAAVRVILEDFVYQYSTTTTRGVVNAILYYIGSFIAYLADIFILPLILIPLIQWLLFSVFERVVLQRHRTLSKA